MKKMKTARMNLAYISMSFAVLIAFGVDPPSPMVFGGLTACAIGGLLYGFFWRIMLPQVRGTGMVMLGIAAMFIPPQFVVSAALIGAGIRLLMEDAPEPQPVPQPELSAEDIAAREAIQQLLAQSEPSRALAQLEAP